jgi:hypothetical protein
MHHSIFSLQKFLLSVLLVCFFFVTRAQQNQFEVGIESGANITSLHGDKLPRYFDWQLTPIGSIKLQYHFTDILSLVAQMGYESKGCKGKNLKLLDNEGMNLGSNYTFSYTYQYLTVPVLLRYTSINSGFFVNAGPYMGYLLQYTEKMGPYTLNRTSDMGRIDFGVSLGLGMSFPVSDRINLTFELRNNLGLTNVWTSNETYQSAVARPAVELNPVRTNALNILIGLSYQL